MKKTFFLLTTAFLLVTNAFSQDMASLKIGAEKIFNSTSTLNYDLILDATYPKVFEFVTRAQLKELLISTFSGSDEMKIRIVPTDPEFKYGDIKKIGDQTFCLIDHNLAVDVVVKAPIEDEEEAALLIDVFKSAMETQNVTFNKDQNSFRIIKRSTLIGIFDKYTNNEWRFLNRDKNNVLANKLLSKKAIKELGL